MNRIPGLFSLIRIRESSLPRNHPAELELPESEIQVWRRHHDPMAPELKEMSALLSDDELERASRFRFEKDRNEFVVSRGTLRRLLCAYVGISTAEVRFEYTKYGRPTLIEAFGQSRIDFNVSHSGGVILWAFARGRRIGVDVEKSKRDFNPLEIAERFFSPAERETLRALPTEQRRDAFFRCWTRKESFIKALGEGLSHPLDQFDVTLAPKVAAKLLATRPDESDAERWAMWDITVPNGYSAALTAELK